MVRKKFDRTVVKRCPQCEENVPVACKFCTCGHPFATRTKILLKEEAEEAMGLLDGSASDTKGDDNSSSESRRRPRRLTRERPNYYVITTELNNSRHVKKKARQKERNRVGPPGLLDNNTPKKKKRGRPRGSGSSTSSSGTRTRSKTKKLPDHYPNTQPSHGLQIKKEELGFTDTKSSISSSLSYGCVVDKPLTNVTVSICTAPNSCCTTNISSCNVTKHHVGNQGNNSSYSSSSDGANSNSGSHGKDITISSSNQTSTSNGHSNTMTNNTSNIKNQVISELSSSASSNNNSININNTYNINNNNNFNNQKDTGVENDMYSSMSFENSMKFYAILADLNRKMISQSFKPL